MTYHCKKASSLVYGEIVQLRKLCYRHGCLLSWLGYKSRRFVSVCLARNGMGKIVGWVAVHDTHLACAANSCEIPPFWLHKAELGVFIDRRYRQKGIGRTLVRTVTDRMRKREPHIRRYAVDRSAPLWRSKFILRSLAK